MTSGSTGTSLGNQQRFEFGRNWQSFSRELDEERITAARVGVERLLQTADLSGKTFLDVGCGSGLMSLAAYQMGARVCAFDYDLDSVRTTRAVRDRFAGQDAYQVTQGSALDLKFMSSLGLFDVVYSWGVLHHTGDLWTACDVAAGAVAPSGALAIAIYNDQGPASRVWKQAKKRYVKSSPVVRKALVAGVGTYFTARHLVGNAVNSTWPTSGLPGLQPSSGTRPRGMDRKHDLVDWVGGYPFEVAKPEEIFNFYRHRGFLLEGLTTCAGGLGCNEFLFTRAFVV